MLKNLSTLLLLVALNDHAYAAKPPSRALQGPVGRSSCRDLLDPQTSVGRKGTKAARATLATTDNAARTFKVEASSVKTFSLDRYTDDHSVTQRSGYSPDGQYFYITLGKTYEHTQASRFKTVVWSNITGRPKPALDHRDGDPAVFSADGHRFYFAGVESDALDLESGDIIDSHGQDGDLFKDLGEPPKGTTRWKTVFSPNRRFQTSVMAQHWRSVFGWSANANFVVVDSQNGKAIFSGDEGTRGNEVAKIHFLGTPFFSGDSRYFIFATRDSNSNLSNIVFDLEKRKVLPRSTYLSGIGIGTTQDGRYLVTSAGWVYDLQERRGSELVGYQFAADDRNLEAHFSPQTRYVVFRNSVTKDFQIFRVDSGRPVHASLPGEQIQTAPTFSSDDRYFLVRGYFSTRIYDLATGQVRLQERSTTGKFSANGRYFLTLTNFGSTPHLAIYDLHSPDGTEPILLPGLVHQEGFGVSDDLKSVFIYSSSEVLTFKLK